MRFLIVVPKFVQHTGEYYHFPTGLAHISSSLKSVGFEVECLNLNHHDRSVENMVGDYIRTRDIDAVCTGGLSPHYHQVKSITDAARAARADITTIVGGGLVSSEPELMLQALRLDYGVLGEGERTIIELAQAISSGEEISQVRGIITHGRNGDIITTNTREVIEDLTTIPWPDYEGFDINTYLDMQMSGDWAVSYVSDNPRDFSVVSSRSCPYSCTFCYHPLGKKYRQRPLDHFFAELDYIVLRYGINILVVYDDLFSVDRDRVLEFCKRISRFNLRWGVTMRVDGVDDELLRAMKQSGCFYVAYGLESANNSVLRSLKKNTTIQQIDRALKDTYDAGIGNMGNFILPDVSETKETAWETIEWWKSHTKYRINFLNILAFPGTELYYKAIERGLIDDRLKFIEDGCPALNLSAITDQDYQDILHFMYKDSQRLEYMIIPEIIDAEYLGSSPQKGDIYSLTLKCPHCESITTYARFNNTRGKRVNTLACRVCNQRYDLLPWMYDVRTIKERLQTVTNLIQAGSLSEALTMLTNLSEQYPTFLAVHTVLANLSLTLKCLEQAALALKRASALSDTDPEVQGLKIKFDEWLYQENQL
jgi:radical SAM superfamily enzyme YgiQ (UPF0313 family)